MRRASRLLCVAAALVLTSWPAHPPAGPAELERAVAVRLQRRAQRGLERMLGPGRALVSVRVEMDRSKVVRIETAHRAGGGRARRERAASGPAGVKGEAAAIRAATRTVRWRSSRGARIGRITATVIVDEGEDRGRAERILRAMLGREDVIP